MTHLVRSEPGRALAIFALVGLSLIVALTAGVANNALVIRGSIVVLLVSAIGLLAYWQIGDLTEESELGFRCRRPRRQWLL